MKKLSLIVLLFICSFSASYCQSIGINFKAFNGIWNNEPNGLYNGGGGLSLQYEHPLKKGELLMEFEFRTINWGNQIALNAGYKMGYLNKEKWSLSGVSSVGFGLALFKDNPLFVWSATYMPEFSWHIKEKLDLNFGFGARYSNCPSYKNYGSINQVLELPIKIGFQFNLTGKSFE